MKWPIVGLLFLGLVAALCAAILVTMYGFGGSKDKAPQDVIIGVAKEDIPATTRLSEEMFEMKAVPATDLKEGFVKDSTLAAGRVLIRSLEKGQQISKQDFAPEGSGADIAGRLEPGKRAMMVALADWEGIQGLLYPGSIVDVMVTFSIRGGVGTAVSTLNLQGVQVLSVDDEVIGEEATKKDEKTDKSGPARPTSARRRKMVTLMVDPVQAQGLQLALQHGTISLTLRNPRDREWVETTPIFLNAGQIAKEGIVLRPESGTGLPVLEPTKTPATSPRSREEGTRVWVGRGTEVKEVEFKKPVVEPDE